MTEKKNTILFLGFGYVAEHLALLLDTLKIEYFTLSSRKDTSDSYKDKLKTVTHILITAPPDNDKDPILNLYRDMLTEYASHIQWLGYLSSTSVYGNHHGNIVTELSECNPTSKHGKNRLDVEKLWQDFTCEYQIPLHIFRLTGIYGVNRNSINDVRFSQAVNIIKQGHLINRIYVKDIAKALWLSMQTPTPNEIFNLTDDMPCSTAAINDYIAFLLDKPQLPKIAYEDCLDRLSDMRKSFYEDSKIVCNKKIKTMLNLTLDFPTYREGIADILSTELMLHNHKIH